jgi:osmotically-inducible protein OsmY
MPAKVRERRTDIERTIQGAFDRMPGLSALGIAITVDGSCASLCGMVLTPGQRDQAEALARATPGVLSVKNYLSLNLFQ